MSEIINLIMQVVLLLAFIGGIAMGFYSLWHLMPSEGRDTLQRALRRIQGKQVSRRSGPPIYIVRVDGQC